jgi:ParB-like chromosome segregation protein Spo0J
VVRKAEDNGERVVLVAGAHRLEAVKQLGHKTIQCTILSYDDADTVEQSAIDENTAREGLSPVRHALSTQRRTELLIKDSSPTTLQITTALNEAKRRAEQKTASVRGQASKSGESKDRIHRSRKWFRVLGEHLLDKIADTSLDRGVELNALAELPGEVREDLANRGKKGEGQARR